MSYVSYNLKMALDKAKREKNLSIEKIHRITGISKTTIYDIMAGRVEPKEETLRKLEKVLEISEGTLTRKYESYDKDFFLEQLKKVYKPVLNENSGLYNDPDFDGGEVYYTLEEYLIIECGMDVESVIHYKMPSEDVKNKIAEKFNLDKVDLFKPLNSLSVVEFTRNCKSIPDLEKINILSTKEIKDKELLSLFKELDNEYQKVIYNMMCDFYILSHQHDFVQNSTEEKSLPESESDSQ